MLQQNHHKVNEQEEKVQYMRGRGAQYNTKNRFIKNEITQENVEAVDDWEKSNVKTQYIKMQSKTIVNKVESKRQRCAAGNGEEKYCFGHGFYYII